MTLSNVVTIRDFNANLCKILENVVTKKQDIVVTKHGKPYIVVTIPGKTEVNVVTKPVLKTKLDAEEAVQSISHNPLVYGCGCVKVAGEVFCSKHNRL